MSNEIHVIGPTGNTCYAHIINASGQRWNGAAYEDFSVADYANYDVSVAEDGATGIYIGDIPSTLPAGRPDIVLFVQDGGSPANGDRAVGAQALDWRGSSTSPVTVPLGSLTGAEMLAYIVRSGFRRTDMDTQIYDGLTDTVLEMEQHFRFDEREKESVTTDTISVSGDYKLTLESDFGHLVTVVLLDGDTSKPLNRISKALYDLLYTTPPTNENLGYPESFAIFANQIYIGPPPQDLTHQYRLSYSERLTATIDASTDPVPFSAKYREVLKDGVMRRLFKNLKNWEVSDQYLNAFGSGMERAMTLERRNRGTDGFAVSYRDV